MERAVPPPCSPAATSPATQPPCLRHRPDVGIGETVLALLPFYLVALIVLLLIFRVPFMTIH